jgi:hypothetical protein
MARDRPLTISDFFVNLPGSYQLTGEWIAQHLTAEFIDLRTPEQRQDDLQRVLGQVECASGGIHGLWCSQGAVCSFCKAVV